MLNRISAVQTRQYQATQVHYTYKKDHLKGVCHEIFDLQFFSWFEFIGHPDKQAKVFSNSVAISLR